MGAFKKLFGSDKDRSKKNKKPKIQAFRLEQLRTPSGLVDGFDETDIQFAIDNSQFAIEGSEIGSGQVGSGEGVEEFLLPTADSLLPDDGEEVGLSGDADNLLLPTADSLLPNEAIEIEEIPFIDSEEGEQLA